MLEITSDFVSENISQNKNDKHLSKYSQIRAHILIVFKMKVYWLRKRMNVVKLCEEGDEEVYNKKTDSMLTTM